MKYFELNKPEISSELAKFLLEEEKSNNRIEKTVQKCISEIKKHGFKAVAKYSKKFDNFDLTEENAAVSEKEIDTLAKKISPELSKSLEIAVKRVTDFHEREIQKSFFYIDKEKNKMGQKIVPINSSAIYIPGGGAVLASTLYMTAIPAIIAGVKRIVLFSPPRTFIESPAVAKLVKLLKIKEIYRIGGAQAIIAAAYGAGPIKPVDKIAGPGNIFVATAKKLVYGKADIDMIAGPSEILVIADTDKEDDIPLIAADLLSQAEHPPGGFARAILMGTDKNYLFKIKEELYKQANSLPVVKNSIKSLDERGLIISCRSITDAVEISNLISPEHLELFSNKPYKLLDSVKNAGSVFLGRYTPESVGDYLGGPNHVLPTSRTARFFSPLGVYDFQKRFSWIEFSRNSLNKYKNNISSIAESEGLYAHARSAFQRFKK